ncbi:ABC transporter substrate-binding protein, partial [Paraburkholderia dilworthii]|uniref:ABC transporter substrate-binding protein n=1 Tax=Paraburkholderia dilworthii TaxID=948106 RepID=UPI001FCBBF53
MQTGVAQERPSGLIVDAIVGEPPTLDPAITTADVVAAPSEHIFETLFTFDSHWNVQPLLADRMPAVSADRLTYTIPLRRGVAFHNGTEMSAADVVASLTRWQAVAVFGKDVHPYVEYLDAPGDHTVVIKLKEPYMPLLALLATQVSAAVVVPKSVIKGGQLTALIGTGPYSLAEHKPDQYIKLVRFKGYSSRKEP